MTALGFILGFVKNKDILFLIEPFIQLCFDEGPHETDRTQIPYETDRTQIPYSFYGNFIQVIYIV